MSRLIYLSIVFAICYSAACAQTKITGIVFDSKDQPLAGVSVTVKGTYDGSTTDTAGRFSFVTSLKGDVLIIVSHIGYEVKEQKLIIDRPEVALNVILRELISEMKAVVVSAGIFEASDKRRATVLKPIDIVTTAGAQADIFGAIGTLPGVQQIGETEGLFVRGGTGAENKVFIDGLLVKNPFNSGLPDISSRGRFSPLLFKGTIFSSGGYSAQFGQGMSSALILESVDLPLRSEIQVSLTSIGAMSTFQHLGKKKMSSTGGSLYYGNLSPYYHIIKQRPHFLKAPENGAGEFFFRTMTKGGGMLKGYFYTSSAVAALSNPSLNYDSYNDHYDLKNRNGYANISYREVLGNRWKFLAGISFNYNRDHINKSIEGTDTIFSALRFKQTDICYHSKLIFTKSLRGLSKLNIGFESLSGDYRIRIVPSTHATVRSNIYSAFAEEETYLSPKLVLRAGIRGEFTERGKKFGAAPRLALAYKIGSLSQISLAYGWFYQEPETKYLLASSHLQSAKAIHYIANFQRISDKGTFRVELFYKKYNNLVVYDSSDLTTSRSEGNGAASGLEFFWRDKKGFKGIDYWISYSLLNTRRQFLNYPISVQPGFASKHTISVVLKKFVSDISTNFGLTYAFATGRPYFNPNLPPDRFMSEHTIDYHSMSATINYLTPLLKTNSVIFLYITNVLGSKQIFGYHFSDQKNSQGIYSSAAIIPPAKRFIMLGIFMSIGVDRRQDIINN